jgi:hypothetical protein
MEMLDNRLLFHEELVALLGSRNVYFQPPENIRMVYPCIIYSRDYIENVHADNIPYLQNRNYQVIVVDPDPDSEIVERVSQFPRSRFDRHYVADNLNHDVFTIYYK